jgi:hypothetical protein
MRMGPIVCTEKWVRNYFYSLYKDTEERSSLKILFSPIGCGAYQDSCSVPRAKSLPMDKAGGPVANRLPSSSAGM